MIFVDWGGVLSNDEYWTLLRAEGGDLGRRLDAGMDWAWHERPEVAAGWMLGKLSTSDVLARMELPPAADQEFLRRRLSEDMTAMRVPPGTAAVLARWREKALLIAASDNIREFADVFEKSRMEGAGGNGPAATLAGVAPLFDGVLCSCDIRGLKGYPATVHHFRDWLERHDLAAEDTILIDDKQSNCQWWTDAGGTAYRYTIGGDIAELDATVSGWLAERVFAAHEAGIPDTAVTLDAEHTVITHLRKRAALQGEGSEFGDPAYMTELTREGPVECPQCGARTGIQLAWPGNGRSGARARCTDGHEWRLRGIAPDDWRQRKGTNIHLHAGHA